MNTKRLLAGFLLASVFLYIFLRKIDLGMVWNIIKEGNPWWLLACATINFSNYLFRAMRWRYFLLPIKDTGLWNRFSTTIIGFSVNTLFPAKLGEVIRPYLLGKKENISRSSALATVVVERIFDTLAILFMLVFYLLFLVKPDQLSQQAQSSLYELKRAGLAVFVLVLIGILFLYYLKTKPDLVRRLIRKIEKRLPARMALSLDELLDSFIHGLSTLHDPKMLLTISCWSIAFWLIICAGFWAGVRAYVPDFAFTGTFLIMILLAIGIALPTPGAVGSYHLLCQFALTHFFGILDTKAGAVALVSHFLSFLPVTLFGLVLLWKEGLSTAKLQKMAGTEGSKD